MYICVNDFCKENLGEELWNSKTDDEKIDIILEISEVIKDHVNERIYNEIQLNIYNSTVEDFKIQFEKEKIAKSGLFVAKKNYAIRSLWVEGEKKEKISTTGLAIVRGDSSEAIRYRLKDIMFMILRNEDEKEISKKIHQYKKELIKVYPEEIAANIGVKNIDKYISDNRAIKGTPWHVKGVINYRMILKDLGIENVYENVYEGNKAKVVYVKSNKYNIETITFHRWPKEFRKILSVDMAKMVDKFFIKKVKILLEPMNKISMITAEDASSVNYFFK